MQISMRVHMYLSTAFPSFSPVFESFIIVHPSEGKKPIISPHVSLSYLQLLVPVVSLCSLGIIVPHT